MTTTDLILPHFRETLHQRGIADHAIARARIHPNGRGWLYPFRPGDTRSERWKAFPDQPGAKCKWYTDGRPGTMPDDARLYDPAGDLAQHIAAAGGVVILASGEPDVWACWSAGLFNVTCTMQGEGTIPAWFADELPRQGARAVQLWPDRDQAGVTHARKVSAALAGTGIAVEVYALPFDMGSKGDINKLLLQVGADRLRAALESCGPLELPADQPAEDRPKSEPSRRSDLPASRAGSFDSYLRDEFHPRVPSAWLKGARNATGFHKNVSCPTPAHEDRKPSFGYNPDSHTGYCFVCGTISTDDLADLIGAPRYERPKTATENSRMPASIASAKVISQTATQPLRDPDVRTAPWQWSGELRGALMDIHTDWPDAYEDLSDLINGLDRVILAAEQRGLLPLGAPLDKRSLAELNAALGAPLGDTPRQLINRLWELGVRAGAFVLKTHKELHSSTLCVFRTKALPPRQNGQRGPSQVIILRDLDVFLDRLVSVVEANALRAATNAPPGERFFAPDDLRTEPPYDLSPAELAAAERARAPVKQAHQSAIEQAERRIRTAARVLRTRLADAAQTANAPAPPIPADTPTPNKLAYKLALLALKQERDGPISIEPNRGRVMGTGLKVSQLPLAREKLERMTDKRYRPHPLVADLPVADQVDINRNYGWRLEASNGATYEITARTYPYTRDGTRDPAQMEAWAARQRAEGATITAKEQIASIERPANEAEKALIAARADRRREKQAEYRERRQALGQGKPAEPRATPTRLDRLPERYGWRQVTFGLADYTEYKIEGDTLINTVTGARREQPTIRDLALAWAGLLDEGADMPTLTAMSHDKYEGADHEQAQATIADAAPAADSDDPLLDDLSRVGPPIDRGLSDRRHVDVSQTLWLKRGNGQRTGASRRGMENGRHAQYARPDTPGHVSRGVRPYARLDDRIRVPGMAVRLAGTAYELPPDTEGKRADKAHVCHPSGGRAEPTNARLTRHLFDYGGDPVVERVNGLPYTAAMLRRREARLAGEG